MTYPLSAGWFALSLSLGMLLCLAIGRWVGVRRMRQVTADARQGIGAIEGAVFGLMGLLIAFTFSGATSRFDTRRQLIVEEANAIGTAYLRLDLLPAAAQPALREHFRRYVDTRLAAYRKLPDIPAALEELARATTLQGEIWAQATAACQMEGAQGTTMLVLPALNAMIDITTTRTMATRTHPPWIIFVMLLVLTLTSALFIGYDTAGGTTHHWLHILGFVIIMTVAVYVIMDIEFPRFGLIRIDAVDQLLVDVRKSME